MSRGADRPAGRLVEQREPSGVEGQADIFARREPQLGGNTRLDQSPRGLDRDDAVRAARIEAGGASQAMDALRDQRGLPWLDDLTRDVGHGLRTLRRAPMFAAVAILTLALGIGANSAIFSIVNGVILRPLDLPIPKQLMYLSTEFPALGLTGNPL